MPLKLLGTLLFNSTINFNELCDAAVAYLNDKEFQLYPDFLTGGYIDVERYNDGERGGSVKVRANITKLDNRTLVIKDIPFGKNTSSIVDSINYWQLLVAFIINGVIPPAIITSFLYYRLDYMESEDDTPPKFKGVKTMDIPFQARTDNPFDEMMQKIDRQYIISYSDRQKKILKLIE